MAFWLFQGNPQYYRVLDAIKELEQIPWLVTLDVMLMSMQNIYRTRHIQDSQKAIYVRNTYTKTQ
ncbi:hypothetical protein [Dolichospermum compactum]|uniref:Uncharacterized protein n=1 Tax=Dolichospermum compactum NIES-806 TaxID=1973481 RepID=A0A1Z4V2J1_9CYAN|nr:hypothetical protein [Dolichospermum compactum]BAZ85740.1 hypothetical protein NIES806_19440 [Dolichospermum compactum NIES-806]